MTEKDIVKNTERELDKKSNRGRKTQGDRVGHKERHTKLIKGDKEKSYRKRERDRKKKVRET